MPELPPIEEKATLDASQFVAALEALAAGASRAAEAQAKLVAALEATQQLMDDMAGAAAEAAGAERAVAEGAAALGQDAAAAATGVGVLDDGLDSLVSHAAGADASLESIKDALGDLAAGAQAAKASLGSLAADTAADSAVMIAALNAVDGSLNAMAGDAALASARTIAAINRVDDSLNQMAMDAAADSAVMTAAMNRTADAAAGAAARAWTPWWTFGNNFRTVAHWVLAGSAEFLAVAVPAAIALGEGLLVASQGAQNAYNHMEAVWTAAESMGGAFHTTMGQVLGLKDTLQQAQNAANPAVYEILGSGLNDLQARFGGLAATGLDVVHMFDEFSGRVTLDLRGALGAEAQGLLAGMTRDLEEFGQVLGNLGHAVLNFAADMPGLAHVLLNVLDFASKGIELFSDLPAPIITSAMALEEFYRWGGLVLGMLVRITGASAAMDALGEGGFIFRFGAALQTLIGVGANALSWMGNWIQEVSAGGSEMGLFGNMVSSAGAKLGAFAENLTPMAVAGMAAIGAAVAVLAIEFDKVRNASQQTIDTTNQAIASATDMAGAMSAIGKGMGEATVQIQAQQKALNSYNAAQRFVGEENGRLITGLEAQAGPLGGVVQGYLNATDSSNGLAHSMVYAAGVFGIATGIFDHFFGGATEAASQIDQLRAAQEKWVGEAIQMTGNAARLGAAFHTTAGGAAALAAAAGVNLNQAMLKGSEAFKIAVQQIQNYIRGMGAMTAPLGTVGNDITALGIQSQLAGTKVSQLNQAWDSWIQSATAGASDMSQMQESLLGMSHAALSSSVSISGSIGDIRRAADGTSYSLQGMGQMAMQSWQQFTSAIGTGEQALDTLRTGMAENVVSGQQFGSTVRGLVGEMLPFTQGNRNAVEMLSQLAHESGGPVTQNLKTLAQWAGVTGKAAMEQFVKGMLDANSAMGQMAQVAQNLSATMSTDLNGMFARAAIQAAGLGTALSNLANAMANPSTSAATLQGDLSHVITKLLILHESIPDITGYLNGMGVNISQAGVKALIAGGHLNSLAASEARAGASAAGAAGQVAGLAADIAGLHSKTVNVDVNTYYQSVGEGNRGGHTGTGPGRAAGGPVAAGMPYTVGESGRELFVPAQPGSIVPAPQTQAIMAVMAAANANAGGGQPSQAQPQVIHLTATINHTTTLDGEEVSAATQVHAAQWEIRNGRAWPGSGRSQ